MSKELTWSESIKDTINCIKSFPKYELKYIHIIKEINKESLENIHPLLICDKKTNYQKILGHGLSSIYKKGEYFIVDRSHGIIDIALKEGDIISVWYVENYRESNQIILIMPLKDFYAHMLTFMVDQLKVTDKTNKDIDNIKRVVSDHINHIDEQKNVHKQDENQYFKSSFDKYSNNRFTGFINDVNIGMPGQSTITDNTLASELMQAFNRCNLCIPTNYIISIASILLSKFNIQYKQTCDFFNFPGEHDNGR